MSSFTQFQVETRTKVKSTVSILLMIISKKNRIAQDAVELIVGFLNPYAIAEMYEEMFQWFLGRSYSFEPISEHGLEVVLEFIETKKPKERFDIVSYLKPPDLRLLCASKEMFRRLLPPTHYRMFDKSPTVESFLTRLFEEQKAIDDENRKQHKQTEIDAIAQRQQSVFDSIFMPYVLTFRDFKPNPLIPRIQAILKKLTLESSSHVRKTFAEVQAEEAEEKQRKIDEMKKASDIEAVRQKRAEEKKQKEKARVTAELNAKLGFKPKKKT